MNSIMIAYCCRHIAPMDCASLRWVSSTLLDITWSVQLNFII